LIRYINLPEGPGVRNDQGVYAGYTVPVFYDPMLSKLIVHGQTRADAIARMRRALAEYRVEGIMTTIPFFTFIMNHPDFMAGQFDTGFIDRILPGLDFAQRPADPRQLDAAIAAAAILAFEESQNVKLPDDVPSRWRDAAREEAVGGRL
jgi:acetyl-CoA carboxylase biotin carboxylase subunit